MRLWLLILTIIPTTTSFLWNLFGNNNGCNCCKCPQSFHQIPSIPNSMFFQPHNNYQFATPQPSYQLTLIPVTQPNSNSYTYQNNMMPTSYPTLAPSTLSSSSSYRGPPSASPNSREELEAADYSTNRISMTPVGPPVQSMFVSSPPITAIEYGDYALTQLENELAAEKYKYNQRKEKERLKLKNKHEKKTNNNMRQNRIKVYKITPNRNKIHNGMVEWQNSQMAKYTHEKDGFTRTSSGGEEFGFEQLGTNQGLEEFIPIEIGSRPDFADNEPAGPPPNVRNRISHDPNTVYRRRFIS